jgi:hypothetical protein
VTERRLGWLALLIGKRWLDYGSKTFVFCSSGQRAVAEAANLDAQWHGMRNKALNGLARATHSWAQLADADLLTKSSKKCRLEPRSMLNSLFPWNS